MLTKSYFDERGVDGAGICAGFLELLRSCRNRGRSTENICDRSAAARAVSSWLYTFPKEAGEVRDARKCTASCAAGNGYEGWQSEDCDSMGGERNFTPGLGRFSHSFRYHGA